MNKSAFIKILGSREIFIISPHQDDAMLSTGMLLDELVNKYKNKNITIINCFTNAHNGPYTLSAKQYLKYNKFSNASLLAKSRELEDKDAFSDLNLKIINLGINEALFRKNGKSNLLTKIIPEINHIYPTYKWHILAKISKKDTALALLKKSLLKYKKRNALYLIPYGIGDHVDHKITRKVSEEVFDKTIIYSDFPYNIRLNYNGKPSIDQNTFSLNININDKIKRLKKYKTQFNNLFPGGIMPKHDEIFFINKNYDY